MSVDKFPMVYVLELENSKYYIGYSNNVNERLYKHFYKNGSEWTKKYKPIKLLECVMGDKIVEKSKTLEYMTKYGWENVRGASWCQVDLKSAPDLLSKSMNSNFLSSNNNSPDVCHKKKIDEDCIDDFIYVLELSDNKYYIGFQRHNTNTIDRHISGEGPSWTKEYRPLSVIEKFSGTKEDEKKLTLTYMKTYGWENVRGYAWSQITMKNPPKDLANFTIQ